MLTFFTLESQKLQQDLSKSEEQKIKIETEVGRLQHDCKAKGEEILNQKHTLERLIVESNCAKERNEFTSKVLTPL